MSVKVFQCYYVTWRPLNMRTNPLQYLHLIADQQLVGLMQFNDPPNHRLMTN